MNKGNMLNQYPLTSSQREIWFDQMLHPDAPLYNIGGYIHILGAIDPLLLERAAALIIQGHDALRTIMTPGESEIPLQNFPEEMKVSIPFFDFSEDHNPQQAATEWMENEFVKSFDLYHKPLFRFSIIKVREDRFHFVSVYHHLILDGWGMALINKRLGKIYSALSEGENSAFSNNFTGPSYVNFIEHDRLYLESSRYNKDLQYWVEKYKTPPEPLFPVNYSNRSIDNTTAIKLQTAERQVFYIERPFYNRLLSFAKEMQSTPSQVMLAVLYAYFTRTTQREELVAGLPILNRSNASFKETVGLFMGVSPALLNFGTDLSFRELLKSIGDVLKSDYRRQRLPISDLYRKLGLQKRGQGQLFDIQLIFAKYDNDVDFGPFKGKPTPMENNYEQIPLTISVWEFYENEDVQIDFVYNLLYFNDEKMKRFYARFMMILAYVLDHADESIRKIPLMTNDEQQKLIAWNQRETDYPQNVTIVDLFQSQVEKTPDKIALVFENQQLTYRELNQKANQLAHCLLTLNPEPSTPEPLTGLFLDRSLEMIIGLLGILKAGYAYVPLDPDYPQERLQFMLEDSGVDVVLTQSLLQTPRVGAGFKPAPTVLLLDRWEDFAVFSGENPVRQISPDNRAYVIYTSGSTGRPKGVVIEHKSIFNYQQSMMKYFTKTGNFALVSTIAADLGNTVIYSSLCLGGTLHILSQEKTLQPDAFMDYCQTHEINYLKIVPSHLAALLANDSEKLFSSCELLILGGEASQLEWIKRLQTQNPQCGILNHYGPSEATVGVLTYEAGILPDNTATLPIGRPLANTRIYILDEYNNPTPPGISGELCIAGGGLARGYLNRPELTTEKFIETPLFGKEERIYKTGDLARWLPEGNIEFLGRIDNQVKIRGYRIEPEEIEAVLRQKDDIKEAVVVLYNKQSAISDQQSAFGDESLAAYVTLAADNHEASAPVFDTGILRTWLKNRLPEYMIPSGFMVLECLPLNANGKIDRMALPDPDWSAFSETYEAPRNDKEQVLAEVWSHVLRQQDIGIFDNFFELGGDSILSIQITARARIMGWEISPRDLFRHQTISELAQVVKPLEKKVTEQGMVTGEVPLTPIQQRFFAGTPKEPWHYNQYILLEVPYDINGNALRTAMEKILSHHDALRLRRVKNEKLKIVEHKGEIPFHVEELSHLSNEEALQALQERTNFWQSSLNLETGPLTWLVLFRLNGPSRLLWCIHHLAVDGVSWRFLLEDLYKAYHQAVKRQTIDLPLKTGSFKAWAERISTWNETSDYWVKLPETKPLPVDNPMGGNLNAHSQHYTIHLSPESTQRLLTKAQAAYRTGINDLLLTALALCLHEWTGKSGHFIDLESHGRADLFEELDLSRTVGWFTSLHTIFLQMPADRDRGAILKSIKEQLRQIPHEGVGYGVLRYLYKQALPQGEILFNYLGQFDRIAPEGEWKFAEEESGKSYSLHQEREYLIEIIGKTRKGRLSLTWIYSRDRYKARTIERVANNYKQKLEQLIDHCTGGAYGYTVSDFPLTDFQRTSVGQTQLNTLVEIYGNQIVDIYPLSPMQQGMLFHTLYAPEKGLYFSQLHFVLKGPLNMEALIRAWQYLIDRHTVLRTCFYHETDTPLQLVCKTAELEWRTLDWRAFSEIEQKEKLQTLLQTERNLGFDLTQGPLMRMQVIRERDSGSRLVWHHHHLLLDGWCLPILFMELFEAYSLFTQGRTPLLPPIRPFKEYITWLHKQDQEKAEKYWREYLKGFSSPTPLPIGESGKGEEEHEELWFSLTGQLSRQLKEFSRSHRLTLNTIIQGAWAILLGRYSGEREVVFGVTTSGRHIPVTGIDRMMGLFINTLPLRVNVESKDIATILQTIQHDQQQNNQYAYTNLADIQKQSEVRGGTALFETILVFENYPVDEKLWKKRQADSLQISDFHWISRTNYPIVMVVIPGHEFHFKLTYDRNRFPKESVEALSAHLNRLLENMIVQDDSLWYALPMLTEAEEKQLITWTSQKEESYSQDKTVIDLFQSQVEKTPHKIALVFENQQLTYQELNQKANQLAHCLLTLNPEPSTPEPLTGLFLDRSLEMIIGLLGILKAGYAYVPLDPDYPQERLQFMLEDSGVDVVLTQSHLQTPRVGAGFKPAPTVLLLDRWEDFAVFSGENPVRQISPDNRAYVIYTSGSTGRPKGVVIEHKSIFNYQQSMMKYFTKTGNFALVSTIAADLGNTVIYSSLCLGGTLHILSQEKTLQSNAFMDYCQTHEINYLKIVPSHLAALLANDSEKLFSSCELLILGGEASQLEWIKRLQTQNPQCGILNHYGPSEATVGVLTYEAGILPDNTATLPIGRPLANTRIYILDEYNNPTPPGIPGELCIAGRGLARGYLNRPELTTEKFIEPPLFGKEERIYKTGDLARWLPEGNIEFLGRLDHQVKLRGYRIELGEVEAVLRQQEAIKEAVVVLYNKQSAYNNSMLIAYLTLTIGGSVFDTEDLRTRLKISLPEYMIPAVFMVLDKLPLTPNGKIDKRALPDPDFSIGTGQQPPRTEIEHLLCTLWSQVLSSEITGIESNFFESGGHSLLATRLVSRVREGFGIEMPLPVIFEKPVLMEQALWLEQQQRGSELPQIEPLVEGDPLVLSFAQQRLWFLAQLEGENATYNMPAVLHLSGQLNATALQQALKTLVERHESLRICFPVVNGEATVRINDVYNPLLITDLSEIIDSEQQIRINELIESHILTPFNLNSGPLLSLHLLKLSADKHVLIFNMHHIISDGWSLGVLIREWRELYNSYAQNQKPQLPELPIQYTDYAAWQRKWLEQEILTQQLTYWKEKLKDVPELLELPSDFPRPAVMRFKGRHLQFIMDQELMQRVKQVGRQQSATLFMTLLAAFNVLLYRYSGQTDLVVGSPIANRTQRRTEDLIGFFVNTLVLRTQINSDQTFLELLKEVRQTSLEAYTHQDIPFEYLVEQINPTRSMSHSPLFQVMFVLQNAPSEELELGDLKMTLVKPDKKTAKFDLTLTVTEQEGKRFICEWEYNTDLFRESTIERMTEHFQVLLKGIIDNPERSLSQLPILTESEIQQLTTWNQTEIIYPEELTIVDLFETQVEKTPQNIAVVFKDQQLTYLELNQKANRLTNYLITLNLEPLNPEPLIAICMERSIEMVIGLLGILKSGCAYVPLDPDYPKERLKFMLEDSSAKILLTQNHLLKRLPENNLGAGLKPAPAALCLDGHWEQIASCSEINPPKQSTPDNLAYVIYTSGSTGKPKGTLITHKSVSNYLNWALCEYDLNQGIGAPVQSSIAFDATITSLYLPLLSGTQVILMPEKEEVESLAELLKDSDTLSLIKITPSHLEILNSQLEENQYTEATKALIIGGEALTAGQIKPWLTHGPQVRLINEYGPTESVVGCAVYDAKGQTGLSGNIPIGRPIANTRIYILDKNHNPLPTGIPGELCIAGAGLARGYLNRPELTAEKFIEVQLFGEKQRIYKTGDLVRLLPDGNMEYLGRMDHQIKIRGYRIELGEIENTIVRHEAVQEAVVVLYDQQSATSRQQSALGDGYLAVYITLSAHNLQDGAPVFDREILRTWLKARLPEYMMPAGFVVLDKFPLTPNGKIDRKALPEPNLSIRTGQQPPRTESERLLCALWSQVLGIEVIGIESNFFESGGHSLLATRLVSGIRESFGIEMPLRMVFEKPLLMEQAEWLEKKQRDSKLPQIEPLAEGAPRELSFAQQRLWFLVQLEGESVSYNIPASLRITGKLNESALQQAFTALVKRHESLRTSFPVINGEATVRVNDVYNPLKITDISDLSEPERKSRIDESITEHAQTPFDLSTGPLLSLHLLKFGEEEHLLLFNMHHIIGDGWSMGVLIRELNHLYNDYNKNRELQLPKLPVQYTDYATWQRKWLEQGVLARQLAYWMEKLHGAPELLELPSDYRRPSMISYEGDSLKSTLNHELTYGIKQISRQEGATVFMTLLAAFHVLLYRYSGQTDLLTGTPIANRTHSRTEDLIGFFVNTLVLRTQIDGNQTFSQLLKQVRQTSLEAYANQDTPFEYLVEEINPSRSMSRSPLFQVMFVLQNTPQGDLKLDGLKVSPIKPDKRTAKFDLTLTVEEKGEIFVCDWEYSTDLFRRETITRMTRHFQLLLKRIIENPELSLSRLPLLTESEKQQLIAWNQRETDFPKDRTIVDLFEAQVKKTPNNIAVVYKDQQLTYLELNKKANQLAHYLITRNPEPLNPEPLIALCMERSIEMMIGLFGVLKAGAAYVPIDPNYPVERLQIMLVDSSVSILLTQSHLLERLPINTVGAGFKPALCVDNKREQIASCSDENPPIQSTPESPAYVIYTSGSTGKPKGVVIRQSSVVNYIYSNISLSDLSEEDIVLQFSSISFDASVEEIFPCLSVGGKLILRTEEMMSSTEHFLQTCQDWKITQLILPTAYWNQIISEMAEVMSKPYAIKKRSVVGNSLYATQSYKKGETVITLDGKILDRPTRISVQIGKNQHIDDRFYGRFINHSCNPNTTVEGRSMVAIKDIKFGDEITFDYCETEDKMHSPFLCNCCNEPIEGRLSKKERRKVDTIETNNLFFSPHLRLVNMGGEKTTEDKLKIWEAIGDYPGLLNGYGPTEATVAVTFWKYYKDYDKEKFNEVPIGRPIPNINIYILDKHNQPLPIGIFGELHIGGAGLAKGYLNHPELTSEKFFEIEIFGKVHRLYKTGDLARYLPDGNIEYLGRMDHQVKIRGFRVELGEIEATLCRHESVKEAVVILYNEKDHPRLAAYLVQTSPVDDISGELRMWLQARLPEYMVPSAFIAIDKIPLTTVGKIDRKALPKPDFASLSMQSDKQSKPPRTETEQFLSILWSEVLGFEVTNMEINFFEAGGHSLSATRLVSRIRDSFDIEMPLQIIFEKPALLEQAQWVEKQHRSSELPQIEPVAEEIPPVLSFAQQRLWFLAQLEGQSATYNMPVALRLEGRLNEEALQQAMFALVKRHENLRFSFPEVNGEATVRIREVYNPLTITDLCNLSESEQQIQVNDLINIHAQTPFDLTLDPLLRLHLLKLGEEEQILLFNMHHIISDGWSMSILIREWREFYNAYDQDLEPNLPKLLIQYTDYAAWQRNRLKQGVLSNQLTYWKEKLEGAPELLELPTDYPRPAVTNYKGKQLKSRLDRELTHGIKQLSKQQGVTDFMTLFAAFNILLHRYSGQTDLVVGSPIANRTHQQTEDLIGFFVNTLLFRTQIERDQQFTHLLKQVRQTSLEAYTHQDIPFEYLVDQINPTRSTNRSPLFQVGFVLQNTPEEEPDITGLKITFLRSEHKTSKFDLTLNIEEQDGMFLCNWEYSTDLFRPETISSMTEHFQLLLKGILNNPEQSVSTIPLLTETEKQQLLNWNQRETDYPKNQTIISLFEAQVEKNPNNRAVVFEDQQLSYMELNKKANQLAHYLITLNPEPMNPESVIAICIERSLEMIIALLGILKAGFAYMPLDPNYPKERLRFMLEDSSAPLLLTQSDLLEKLPKNPVGAGLKPALCVDNKREQIASCSEENPRVKINPDSLAYIIYTSGSTGKPKGVMIEHNGLTNLIHAQREAFKITEKSRLLQFASFSFDASVSEIAVTLTGGAALHLSSNEKFLPDRQFIELLNRQSITHVTLPPSFLSLLPREELPDLETIVVAGEACSMELKEKWSKGRRFINAYGPTESTVCATLIDLTDYKGDRYSPPIGKPIRNTEIHILDANNNLLPPGIPGELSIAGNCLARGYLNRPELTAEKFIETELFGRRTRIYKTGDLARWLTDGNLEFLGRMDHQIKLRGFRIEPGEVEHRLREHPGINEAVVVYNPDDEKLNACVILKDPIAQDRGSRPPGADTGLLRDYLSNLLPDYMIPSGFIILDELPVTPAGKIDRQALATLSMDSRQPADSYIAPRNDVEEIIAEIWCKVIKTDTIGVYDNFFELGGDSLLTVQVVNNIQKIFKVQLAVKDIFKKPTVAGIAKTLIKLEPQKGFIETIAALHKEISQMSDEEVETALRN